MESWVSSPFFVNLFDVTGNCTKMETVIQRLWQGYFRRQFTVKDDFLNGRNYGHVAEKIGSEYGMTDNEDMITDSNICSIYPV